jgi:ABC-type uncharacterized transport system ATPase subunit
VRAAYQLSSSRTNSKEVLAVADRICVLRRGQLVGTVFAENATESSLADLMVGRYVILQVDKLRRIRAR